MAEESNVIVHPNEEYWRYFRQRGLNEADVANLGAEHIPNGQLPELLPGNPYAHRWPGNGIRIPYVDINGIDTGAYVVRLIGKQPTFLKIPKALYPGKTRPRAHFPRSNPEMQKGMVVYLCESVIKAEIVAKCGFFAIGVNGCWGYSDRNSNERLILDLRDLPWALIGEIRIFYDSNYATNDKVKAGASGFALRCKQVLGFDNVRVTLLPSAPGGEDWGCDDAYVTMGESWLQDVLESEPIQPELSEMDVKLMQMNEECVFVMNLARVFKYDDPELVAYGTKEFHDAYSNWIIVDIDDKKPKAKKVSRAWMDWNKRNQVKGIEVMPNQPRIHDGYLNSWHDPQIIPAEPSEVWREFMYNMIDDDESHQWLEQWIGHLVQFPGIKMTTYPILVGPAGVGKSITLRAITRMLGMENCAVLGQEDIEGNFNGVFGDKLFTGVDEFLAKDSKIANKLKRMVTEERTMINPKYGKQRYVPSVCNYAITTNEIGALKLDEDDRRAAVIDCTPRESHYGDTEYFGKVGAEYEQNIGAVLGHYLTMDLEGFDRYGNAPNSAAKLEMTEQRRSSYEQLAYMLRADTANTLRELGAPPDLKYISLTALLMNNRARAMLGVDSYSVTTARLLGNACKKQRLLPVGGQVMVNGVRHKVWGLPGASKFDDLDFVKVEITRYTAKLLG